MIPSNISKKPKYLECAFRAYFSENAKTSAARTIHKKETETVK